MKGTPPLPLSGSGLGKRQWAYYKFLARAHNLGPACLLAEPTASVARLARRPAALQACCKPNEEVQ